MILSFDIDGTLARQNNRAFMQACNQVLKLGLSEEDLTQLRYRQFLALPQVARQPEKILAWMYYHPLALSQAKVIKGALEGVEVLSQATGGSVQYCTARYSSNCWWDNGMQEATRNWLPLNGFPEPEKVVFCESYVDKARRLQRLSEVEPVIHIDDHCDHLVAGLAMVSTLHLVAFGVQETNHPHVIALPNWQHIQCIVDYWKGVFHGTAFQESQAR